MCGSVVVAPVVVVPGAPGVVVSWKLNDGSRPSWGAVVVAPVVVVVGAPGVVVSWKFNGSSSSCGSVVMDPVVVVPGATLVVGSGKLHGRSPQWLGGSGPGGSSHRPTRGGSLREAQW